MFEFLHTNSVKNFELKKIIAWVSSLENQPKFKQPLETDRSIFSIFI